MASDFKQICQAHGPASSTSTLAGLWMLDEAAGASTAADSMRTAAMATAGYGTATANTATAAYCTFGTTLSGGIDGQTGCSGNGTSSSLAVTETNSLAGLTEYNAKFTVYCVAQFDSGAFSGSQERTIYARMLDGGTFRGFQFDVDSATGTPLCHFYHINTFSTNECRGRGSVTITTGEPWFLAIVHDGTHTTGGYTFYARKLSSGGSVTADVATLSSTSLSATTDAGISANLMRRGTAAFGGSVFFGIKEAVGIEPRMIPIEELQRMYDAARGTAATRIYSKNLGIIKAALTSTFKTYARILGDSTSVPGDTSVGDFLPRRLQTDGYITRAAHFKPAYGAMSRNATYITSSTDYDVDTAAAAPFATAAPAKRGTNFSILLHTATSTVDGNTEATFSDSLADVFDKTTWSNVTGRFVVAKSTDTSIVLTQKFQVSNTAETKTSPATTIRTTESAYSLIDVNPSATSTGNIVTRMISTSDDAANKKLGVYGCFYIKSSDVTSTVPSGLWWGGIIAKTGWTSGNHTDDSYYTAALVQTFDTALISGISINFAYKVVFVLIGINDANGGATGAAFKANLLLIAARWRAMGFKICFIQQWIPYLASGTSASSRVPVTEYDAYWTAMTDIAVGDVACVSIYQRWIGIPFQYLEGPASPAYSIHAADYSGALRLSIPVSTALGEVAADFGNTPVSRSMYLLTQGDN